MGKFTNKEGKHLLIRLLGLLIMGSHPVATKYFLTFRRKAKKDETETNDMKVRDVCKYSRDEFPSSIRRQIGSHRGSLKCAAACLCHTDTIYTKPMDGCKLCVMCVVCVPH